MTFRSILIGLGLALLISVATYYHSSVMRQVSLSGSLFPPAVIGFLVLVVLVWNPLVRRFSLKPSELAVIAALVLAACYWPGSVFNNLLNKLALPAHWQKVESAWIAADVMSYVPGGSVELGEGHVQDWETLAEGITALDDDHSLRAGFSSNGLRSLERLAEGEQLEAGALSNLRGELNRWIEAGGAEREARALRRAELVRWFPTSVLPPPEGGPLLPEGGAASPEVTDQYLGGGSDSLGSLVPWSTWLPVFGLWVALGLLLAGAALGLTIIVHPQWSRRELLSYPVVTFIREITQPDPQGGRWPHIVNNKVFWVGLVAIFTVRFVNALHEWFPEVMFFTVPLRLDFRALQELLPTAAQVPGSAWVFAPQFDPVLVAFAVFLTRSVSLSLGLAGVVWLAWGTFLLSRGVHAGSDLFGDGPTNLMLFGAYVGAAAMVFYVGRRHYLAVASAAIGLRRDEVSPLWAWAGRGVAGCGVAATILLATLGGLDWPFAVLTVAMTGVIYLIVARIHVETGAIFIHTFWFSSSILPALLGDMAVGPTNLVVMFLFTLVLVEGTQSAIHADARRRVEALRRPHRAGHGQAGGVVEHLRGAQRGGGRRRRAHHGLPVRRANDQPVGLSDATRGPIRPPRSPDCGTLLHRRTRRGDRCRRPRAAVPDRSKL